MQILKKKNYLEGQQWRTTSIFDTFHLLRKGILQKDCWKQGGHSDHLSDEMQIMKSRNQELDY